MGATRVSNPFGGLNSDPDGIDYVEAHRRRAQTYLANHDSDVSGLEACITNLRESDRYRRLDDEFGHPFRNWQHFCTTKQPRGLGMSAEAIDFIIGERKSAQELALKAVPLKVHGVNQHEAGGVDDVKSSKTPEIKGGNATDYLSRRIARDAPEVLERMKAGEFPSVRAAAVEAGIIKVPTLVHQAFRLVSRMTPAERSDFERQIRPLLGATAE